MFCATKIYGLILVPAFASQRCPLNTGFFYCKFGKKIKGLELVSTLIWVLVQTLINWFLYEYVLLTHREQTWQVNVHYKTIF